MAKVEKGTRSDDRGVFIPLEKRMPTNKACLHMSKADFIKAESARKEILAKGQAFMESLQKDKAPEVEEKVEAPVAEKKKAGRPKKIE
jgi:hypothetical protein